MFTPGSLNPRPNSARATASAERRMKSTNSTGVYTIPRRLVSAGMALAKNCSYTSSITLMRESESAAPDSRSATLV